jgi:hypothetical protein
MQAIQVVDLFRTEVIRSHIDDARIAEREQRSRSFGRGRLPFRPKHRVVGPRVDRSFWSVGHIRVKRVEEVD